MILQRIVTKSLWFIRTCTRFSRARTSGSGDGFTLLVPSAENGVSLSVAGQLRCLVGEERWHFSSSLS